MRRIEGKACRIVVAMSGGVDSSTVAGLLVEAGHEVIGVMMKLYDQSKHASGDPNAHRACCGLDDVGDARRVADHLDIPFYVNDFQDVFRREVIDSFVDHYVMGRTPNPCVRCNDRVKFDPLLDRARMLGADYLATGHYVSTQTAADGSVDLHRGHDRDKDQSYFLAGMARDALQKIVFPLGDLTKAEVRAHAERLGLPVAGKAESQEICFVPRDDYAAFVEDAAGDRLRGPGPLVSIDGLSLGTHRGLHRYTVGQRRGLRVSGPVRRYVVSMSTEDNTLVVGGREDVLCTGVRAFTPRWIASPPRPGDAVEAQIRHRHHGVPATVVRADSTEVVLRFSAPVSAVAPGQQLVLYDGTRVLGAATIEDGLGRPGPPEDRSHVV